MYVSTHHFGAFYEYDTIKREFYYSGQDARVGPMMSPQYPDVVKLEKGTHPVLYSALGSHGLWGASGKYKQ